MSGQQQDQGDSVGELASRLTHQVGELVGKELQLARAELREEVSKGVKVTVSVGGAVVEGLLGLVFLSSAAAWGLTEVMPAGWAFLIVGAVHSAVAGLLLVVARSKARRIDPVPRETVESVKEDARWAKNQTS